MEKRDIPNAHGGPEVVVDLDALVANFTRIASACPNAEAAGVVKCDAYGLGAREISRKLVNAVGCKIFFVAHATEGVRLRQDLSDIAPHADIYILNGPSPENINLFLQNELRPILNTVDQVNIWSNANPGAPSALHIDTGIQRLGVPAESISDLKNISGLNISIIMSHLANAATPDAKRNSEQLAAFSKIQKEFPNAKASFASSGGALLAPQFGFDLLRLGVGIYGVNPYDDRDVGLSPVATLHGSVIQIRDLPSATPIGYGDNFITSRPSKIATIGLGYGDGYPRAGFRPGKPPAQVFAGGANCPLAGVISMDLTTIDITDAPYPIAIGDKVEFYGSNVRIEDVARASETIGYELLTRITARVCRKYVGLTS